MTRPVEVPICTLPPGARFELVLWELSDHPTRWTRKRGTLLRSSECSATVRVDAGQEQVTFTRTNAKTGELEEITMPAPAKTEHWSSNTPVVPLSDVQTYPATEPEQRSLSL